MQIPRDTWLTTGAMTLVGAALIAVLWSHQASLPRSPSPTVAPSPTLAPVQGLGGSQKPISTARFSQPSPSLGASAPNKARRAQPKRAYHIAAIGDSLTDPKSHGGKYLEYIQKRCPESKIDNHGRGADMVNQMRRRYASNIHPSSKRYTHLVVFGGVNDLYSDQTAGRTPEKVAKDLLDMYSKANQRGMKVVALTVAPWGGFTRYYTAKRGADTKKLNQWIRDQFDVGTVQHVVDAYSLLSCGRPEYLCRDYSVDGIHFNARGHEVLGKALFEEAFADCK